MTDERHPGAARTRRQHNEAAVYDARAAQLAAALTDEELLVDPGVPPYPNREHVDFLDHVLALLGPLAGQHILEVGCGNGALAVYLAKRGARVVGVDVSEESLRLARRRATVNGVSDRTTFLAEPVETLAGEDGSFSGVVGNQVLHHLELEQAMDNIGRMMGPDGVAVFCEPVLFLPEVFRRIRNSRLVTRLFPPVADTPDERSLSFPEVELVAARFNHSQWWPFQLLCRLQNFVELSDRMFGRLERIDRVVLARVPGSWRLCRFIALALAHREGRIEVIERKGAR